MRQESKGRGCVEDIVIYAAAMLAMLIAFPAVIYIHENAPRWEAPAVFISLGLSALPALWYWRLRRYGWVAAIVAGVLLAFSFTASLFHGWETQALTLIIVAAVAFSVTIFVAGFRITRRLSRHMEATMRATAGEFAGDPLFGRAALFRDDGRRIIVYPRRFRLFLNLLLLAALLAGIGCAFVFLSADYLVLWIVLGLFACLLIPTFLATLYRLVIRRPALEVGPDGILDNGSSLWTGVGLVRWEEIAAVYPTTRPVGRNNQRFLVILVTDLPAIRRRLPLLKRIASRSAYSRMSQLLIWQMLLETPVDDLAEQITQYVTDHAPAGWRRRAAKGDWHHNQHHDDNKADDE